MRREDKIEVVVEGVAQEYVLDGAAKTIVSVHASFVESAAELLTHLDPVLWVFMKPILVAGSHREGSRLASSYMPKGTNRRSVTLR